MRLDTGWGFAADAGIGDFDGAKADDIGNLPLFGLGVGYRINPMFRSDLTFTYRGGYGIDGTVGGNRAEGDITSYATMLNGYFDILVDLCRFKSYVGVGIGWAHNKTDTLKDLTAGDSASGTSTDNLAWQAMLGTGVTLTERLSLDIGYRYFDGGEIKWPANASGFTGVKGDLKSHEVALGLRYGF